MITLKNISKTYEQAEETSTILRDVSLQVEAGEKIAIIWPSGSGKSTLLSIMSGLDRPTSGEVLYDGEAISDFSEKEFARFRNEKIGIIFQSFELVQFFTAYENVMLPLAIRDEKNPKTVDEIFKTMWLEHRKNNLPRALSWGEQQRVAIARVLASGCDIIFADEPTGNLDAANGKKILELLLKLVKQEKKTLVIITHDMNIARQMDRIYEIREGALVEFKQ